MSIRLVNTDPQLVAELNDPGYHLVYVQVFGAGTLRLSRDRDSLQKQFSGGQDQGLTVVSGDGIRNFWWRGQFWVAASAEMKADFEVVT